MPPVGGLPEEHGVEGLEALELLRRGVVVVLVHGGGFGMVEVVGVVAGRGFCFFVGVFLRVVVLVHLLLGHPWRACGVGGVEG